MKIQLEINQENGNNTLPYGISLLYVLYSIQYTVLDNGHINQNSYSLILKLSPFRMSLLYIKLK
jgi:hypothetical protein